MLYRSRIYSLQRPSVASDSPGIGEIKNPLCLDPVALANLLSSGIGGAKIDRAGLSRGPAHLLSPDRSLDAPSVRLCPARARARRRGTHWGTGRSATRDLPGAGAEHIPHPPAGCEELLVRRLLAHDSVLEHTGLAWVPTELDKVGVSWCRSGSAH